MRIRKERYLAAFEELQRRGLKEEYLRMLGTHWAAPLRTVSMAQLAAAAGYPDFRFANLRYGGLASRIAKYGGIQLPPRRIALSAIATWGADSWNPRGHFAFTMRPELAGALEELGLTRDATPPDEPNDPSDALEGEAWLAMARHRRRESALRQRKIAEAIERSLDGRLRCQVPKCGFDFKSVYGSTGTGYAQVHHLKPLSSRAGPERTSLRDLIVVCANCHVMIHRFGALRDPRELIVRRRAG